MAYVTKQREQIIELVPFSFHPGGVCGCRERTIPSGTFRGGSQDCRRCRSLIGKRSWQQPPKRLLGIRYGVRR